MGCGVSVPAIQQNGILSRKEINNNNNQDRNQDCNQDNKIRIKSNSVSPAKTGIQEECIPKITKQDKITSEDKNLTKDKISSKVNIQDLNQDSNVRLQIKRILIRDQFTQSDNLLPEDELEILLLEEKEDKKERDKQEDEKKGKKEEKDEQDKEEEHLSRLSESLACSSSEAMFDTFTQTIITLIGRRKSGLKVNNESLNSTKMKDKINKDESCDKKEKDQTTDKKLEHSRTSNLSVLNAKKVSSSSSSSESQTEPIQNSNFVPAANSASGHDLDIVSKSNSWDNSPLTHIEKQLEHCTCSNNCDGSCFEFGSRTFDRTSLLSDLLTDEQLMEEIQNCAIQTSPDNNLQANKKDASSQTYNDPITDESPEFAARPPPSRKKEMIPNLSLFKDIDEKVITASNRDWPSIRALVSHITADCENDLFKVRAIFRWITLNISYNWKYINIKLSPNEIFKLKSGVCKDYCILFQEMCHLAAIRVKVISGFAKGFDHRPGHYFQEHNQDNDQDRNQDKDLPHNWNAVYILGSWRLIDTTWGTGFTDFSGKFNPKLNEHFFLTDPEILIWSHFPYLSSSSAEANYSRWQLLDVPLSLKEFNNLPKVTPSFFDFNLKIRSKIETPLEFKIQTEIKISSHESMRYKYKLFPADQIENSSLNHYVFCHLKEERLIGSFTITPPIEGRFYFKIYAKPEREMLAGQLSDSSSLHAIVTFLLECKKARKYLEPFPLNELPWGPTQAFYDFKIKLINNQVGPIIASWGGKRKLAIESCEPMLITHQLFDSDGMEMDIRSFVVREDSGNNKTSFHINPPRVGMFKLLLFGMPKPKQKGKWRLPLLASFLIDCKIAKITKTNPEEEDPPPIMAPPSNSSSSNSSLHKFHAVTQSVTNPVTHVVTQEKQPNLSSIEVVPK